MELCTGQSDLQRSDYGHVYHHMDDTCYRWLGSVYSLAYSDLRVRLDGLCRVAAHDHAYIW